MQQLRRFFDWLRERKLRKMDVILIILLGVLYLLFDVFGMNMKFDFNFNTEIRNGYFSVCDRNGGVYIIDSGQQRCFKVNDNKVEWEILAGKQNSIFPNKNESICQIKNLVVDDDNSVYIHESWWDLSGWNLQSESISKYGSDGKYIETQYVLTYDEDNLPIGTRLSNLRVVNGHLEYIRKYDYGFELFKIVNNNESVLKSRYLFDNALTFLQAIVVSSNTNNIYLLDRRGQIFFMNEKGDVYEYCKLKDDVIPFDLVVGSDESIYFTDSHSQSVCRISPQKEIEEVFNKQNVFGNETLDSNEGIILYLSIKNVKFEDGRAQDVICGIFDFARLYVVNKDGEVIYNQNSFELNSRCIFLNMISNVKCIIFIFCIVYLVLRIIFIILFNKHNFKILSVLKTVWLVCTIVNFSVVCLTFSSFFSNELLRDASEDMQYIAHMICKNIDSEKICNINKVSDFMSDDYKCLLEELNKGCLNIGNSLQENMSGFIEKFVGDIAVDIAYSNIRSAAYCPISLKVKNELMKVYQTKYDSVVELTDIVGKNLTVRVPIFDSNGEFVGCIGLQKNVNLLDNKKLSIIVDFLSIFLIGIFLQIFLVNEVIEFISIKKKYMKVKYGKKHLLNGNGIFPYHILRLSNVIFSMSINVSSVFLPVYILSFYTPELGIERIVAGSIPISINVAFIFLASIFALSIFEKFGFKKVIMFSVCCSIISDIILVTASSYSIVVLALLLNGLGYGLLIESKRSYLSKLPYDELNRVQIFCSSGGDSGKFIGLFIGGFLAITLPYNEVFWMSVLIDIVAFGFCIYFCKTYSASGQHNVDEKSKMSLLQLILSKEVFGYLISMPIILGIIAGFAGYYIPMYGSMNNFYGNEISLSLAVVILCPVFFASTITDTVIKKFGKNSIYIAVLTALTAMILLVNFSQFILFFISLLLLGVAYSFGSGVCRYRFSQINKVKEYDENRAQSIYNSFFAVGNITSSLIFAFMLSKNMVLGMWIFTIIIVVVMGVYKICFDRKSNAN